MTRMAQGSLGKIVALGAVVLLIVVAQAPAKGPPTDDLAARVAVLEDLLEHFSRDGDDITITGANLHVVNGEDATATTNGVGNIIVGYNEERGSGDDRSGSHMLVVGAEHNYSSFGGIVVGCRNTTSGEYACVSGGHAGTASGISASVSGGQANTASFNMASVSGGYNNLANSMQSSVSGGYKNTASGNYASVSGGRNNECKGYCDSISGGRDRTLNDGTAYNFGGYWLAGAHGIVNP